MSVRGHQLRFSDMLSFLLNPSIITGIFFCILAGTFERPGISRTAHGVICVVFSSAVPIGLILVLKARGKLSDVEMRLRSERELVYWLCASGYALGTVLLLLSGASWPLWGFLAIHVPNTFVLLALNRRLKVSIHTMILTSLFVATLLFYGTETLPYGLIIVAAAWARWDAGNHTWTQLAIGAVVGAVLTATEIEILKSVFP